MGSASFLEESQGAPSCVVSSVIVVVCALNISFLKKSSRVWCVCIPQGLSQPNGASEVFHEQGRLLECLCRGPGVTEGNRAKPLPFLRGLRSSACDKARGWHPCSSSSSTSGRSVSSFQLLHLPSLPLLLFHVRLVLSLCTLQLVLSVSRMPLMEQETDILSSPLCFI